MTTFTLVATVLFFLLGLVWKKNTGLNFCCKATLFVLAGWGFWLLLRI